METVDTMPQYVPGPVERFGRRMKMEYVGMASVFVVIALIIFADLPWQQSLIATLGTFFLFLGMKKKTRDHLSASLLLFAAATLAREPIAALDWAVPYAAFGICVYLMERFVEKQRATVNLLPAIFLVWSWLSPWWWLGLLYVATYLLLPWSERLDLMRRFAWLTALSLVVGSLVSILRFGPPDVLTREVPGDSQLVLLACFGIPAAISLFAYWRKLLAPHRWNPLVFGLLSLWDVRIVAVFGMAAAVLLSATALRRSVDSDRLRPFFKHAEWHFFWYVLAAAVWAVVNL